jgi:peptide/nickel transport system ATP-binding protein
MSSYPHQISGGQQQRIVIAMAVLSKPELLLLDEPTTALDVTVEAGIVDLIRNISAEFGMSMLYISHNLGLVRETCDRVTVMYSGEAVEVGSVAGVFRDMRHPYTRGLFASMPVPSADKYSRPLVSIPGQPPPPRGRPPGCLFGPRCASCVAGRCDSTPVPMVTIGASPGHESRCRRVDEIDWDAAPAPAAGSATASFGEIVLKVKALSKRYRHVIANDGLTFDARRGETVAIVGESGCGKSTFARILMGLIQANSGSIDLAGLELSRLPVTRRSADTIRSLQMIFQNPFDTLNPSHTVGSQIARVIRKLGIQRDETRIRERVLELLDLVKLPRDFAERRPRQLSGGQKQRVGVARAFAGNPAVVVADEPLSALDVSVQAAVTELLVDIQRREGTTLLFISHDLSVVRYLSDRIVVMYLGQIMEQGRTREVFAPPYHPYTEALLAAVPIADQRYSKRKVLLSGDIPSASNPPPGCRFSTRCPYRIEGTCDRRPPPIQEFAANHRIACHLPREQLSAMQPVFEEVSS